MITTRLHRLRLRGAALAVLAAVPLALAAAPASASPSSSLSMPFITGINANIESWAAPQWGSQGTVVANEVQALGAKWDRESLTNYYYFDNMLPYANAAGINVLPVIPGWADTSDVSGFANFVAQMVGRYGPGTAANLQYFELWNEPFYSAYWNGNTPDPAQYARLYAAAVTAAHHVNGKVKFLIAAENAGNAPTVEGSAATWVDDMFRAVPTLGSMINGVAFHAYNDDPVLGLAPGSSFQDILGGWSFARVDSIHSSFLAHRVNVPFWITEGGWSTSPVGINAVSEVQQATNYTDLFAQVALRPWIRALFVYNLRDTDPTSSTPTDGFGLESALANLPKPAWAVVKAAFTTLNG